MSKGRKIRIIMLIIIALILSILILIGIGEKDDIVKLSKFAQQTDMQAESTTVEYDLSVAGDWSVKGVLNIETGYLSITGTGAIKDTYSIYNSTTFQSIFGNYRSLIKIVTISNGITRIGQGVFAYCDSLERVQISDTVKTIGQGSFYDCEKLTYISMPANGTNIIIERDAFSYCMGLKSIDIPNGVVTIGNSAFEGCSHLKIIEIPNGVTSIESRAFAHCFNLTEVKISASVTNIASDVFVACSCLSSIMVDDGNNYYSSDNGVLFNKNKTTLIKYPVLRGDPIYSDVNAISTGPEDRTVEYKIPDSVTSIGDYTFCNCNRLVHIEMPTNLESIGNYAFYDCSGLEHIKIPDGVTSIGTNAFQGCSALKKVSIPDSVTYIGDYAFRLCGAKSISIPSNVRTIGDGTFQECKGLTEISISNNEVEIGNYAFQNCAALAKISIQANSIDIGNCAFSACTGLTDIEISGNTVEVENDTFKDAILYIGIQEETDSQYKTTIPQIIKTNNQSGGNNEFSLCSLSGEEIIIDKANLKDAKISISGGVLDGLEARYAKTILLTGDETTQLIAESANNGDITWKSNNTNIVTVNDQGVVCALKKGEAIVTAETGNKERLASYIITVTSHTEVETTISLNKEEVSLEGGLEVKLKATVVPNGSVNWTSDNIEVAKVDYLGYVTTKKQGTAIIRARTDDGEKVATCIVNVTSDYNPNETKTVIFNDDNLYQAIKNRCNGALNTTFDDDTKTMNTVLSLLYGEHYLDLSSKNISDISGLEEFKNLRTLYLSGNSISDFSAVDEMDSSYFNLNSQTISIDAGNASSIEAPQILRSTLNTGTEVLTNCTLNNEKTMINIKEGASQAKITINGGNLSGTVITIKTANYVEVTGISLDREAISLAGGETDQLVAAVLPETASNKNVSWTSSNTEIATVNSQGKVTTLKMGTATITATTVDGEKTASCIVTVTSDKVEVEGVSLNKTELNLEAGEKFKLEATVIPDNVINKNVRYISSDRSIVTVDSYGNVEAIKEGTATITATTEDGGKRATCEVTVADPVKVITFEDENLYNAIQEKITVESADNKTINVKASVVNKCTTLDLNSKNISSIQGLENFKNLTQLLLSNNQIIDISPLSGLQSLSYLELTNNQISNISTLSQLSKLKTIVLAGNQISDISSLSGLQSLSYLQLTNNQISDVSAIEGKGIGIKYLYISNQTINVDAGSESSIEAPQILRSTLNTGTETLTHCTLSNDKTRINIEEGASQAAVRINSGNLGGTVITITVENPTIPVSSVTLNKTSGTLNVGEEETLVATVLPENATNKNVNWTSSNTEIATVDENGKVTAVKRGGPVTITATVAGTDKKAEYILTVKEPKIGISPIMLTGYWYQFEVGKSERFTVTLQDIPSEELTNVVIEPNEKFQQTGIMKTGDMVNYTMKFLSAGQTQITAKIEYNGKTYTDSYTFTIKEVQIAVESVALNKQEVTMEVGEEYELEATVLPENATNKNVSFASSNSGIVAVDNNGKIAALGVGTAVITATTENGEKTATCNITVKAKEVPVTGINIDKEEINIKVGQGERITASVLPENASNKKVIWTSSKEEVVTVDEEGNIMAVGEGTATITATTEDGNKTKTCTVTVTKNDLVLQGIEVTQAPTKVKYVEGDKFDKEGMIVTARYNDESERIVTGYTINPNRELTIEDTEVTISYTENGVTQTAVQEITVEAKPTEEEIKVTSEKYAIEDNGKNMIEGITPGTNIEEFWNNITVTGEGIEKEIVKGNVKVETGKIGTGMELVVKKNGEEKIRRTIIVKGDITGDGEIQIMDIIPLLRHQAQILTLGEPQLKAADLSGNGEYGMEDIILILRAIAGIIEIK